MHAFSGSLRCGSPLLNVCTAEKPVPRRCARVEEHLCEPFFQRYDRRSVGWLQQHTNLQVSSPSTYAPDRCGIATAKIRGRLCKPREAAHWTVALYAAVWHVNSSSWRTGQQFLSVGKHYGLAASVQTGKQACLLLHAAFRICAHAVAGPSLFFELHNLLKVKPALTLLIGWWAQKPSLMVFAVCLHTFILQLPPYQPLVLAASSRWSAANCFVPGYSLSTCHNDCHAHTHTHTVRNTQCALSKDDPTATSLHCRQLYPVLSSYANYVGVWHTAASSSPSGALYSFRWAPNGIDIVQLLPARLFLTDIRHEKLCTLGPCNPRYSGDLVDGTKCVLRDYGRDCAAGAPAVCPVAEAAACVAAGGASSSRSVLAGDAPLGSSPPGSSGFAAELLRFMQSSVQKVRRC